MKKGLVISVIIIMIVGIGMLVVSGNDTSLSNSSLSGTNQSPQAQDLASEAVIDQTNPAASLPQGQYVDYDEDQLVKAEDGNLVLFFHASWCPTCKALDQNIKAGSIPEDLTILKVDYDTANDLKKKYGITYQHTLVQVDADGNQLNKWGGSYTVDQIVAELI